MRPRIERYFELAALGTTLRTEVLAGCTTFFTMAYIIFVNPSILSAAGMPAAAVMAATCAAAGLASILMGVAARYPIALAPGMGLNAYFAYAVCQGMHVAWQTALGAVFLSGAAFLLLTLAGVRERLLRAFPRELYSAIATGIGFFIAFIGLRNAGLVVADPATFVKLGSLRAPATLLALGGLVLMAVLRARGVRAAILIGMALTTAVAALSGQVKWSPAPEGWHALGDTAFHLDIPAALRLGLADIFFVFLFVDLFDNLGTMVAVSKQAGMIRENGEIPRANRILLSDAIATMAGALFGTSTVVSYIESTAGLAVGGRSGLTAVVTGALFLLALPLAPLAGAIPAAATAPALILVGAEMASGTAEIPWRNAAIAIPAFVTMLAIPLTFSIANGLAVGFCLYTLIQVGRGAAREVPVTVYAITALFLLRFLYVAGE
ncbi:MAG: NCS2 family permease [Bryobacteraceae bacterium]